MDQSQVLYEAAEGVATITLNRPARLNAWTPTLAADLRQAIEKGAHDGAVRAILITGAGRAFCAGQDMDLLAHRSENGAPATSPQPQLPLGGAERPDFTGRFTYLPAVGKPVIAAVNGPAAGSGLVLALACDVRFAATRAVFTTSFSRRGLTAEHGVSWLLPRLVGPSRALDLLLSARRVAADEALQMGLVSQVFPTDELMPCARAYALDLVRSCSPRSLRIIKRQVWEAQFQTLEEATAIADREMLESFGTADFREGVAHALEKRPARFAALQLEEGSCT